MISVSLGGAQGNAINWQNGDIPSWTYFNGLLTMKVCPHTYKRASREYNSRLEAKNLRGIYKFSFTNVFILYYFFKKFQIVFSYSSLNISHIPLSTLTLNASRSIYHLFLQHSSLFLHI